MAEEQTFAFVAADGVVRTQLTRAMAAESLYLQAAMDAGEVEGDVPLTYARTVHVYIAYMHYRALLRQLRAELHTSTAASPLSSPSSSHEQDNKNKWLTSNSSSSSVGGVAAVTSSALYEAAPLRCVGASTSSCCMRNDRDDEDSSSSSDDDDDDSDADVRWRRRLRGDGSRRPRRRRGAVAAPRVRADLVAAIESEPRATQQHQQQQQHCNCYAGAAATLSLSADTCCHDAADDEVSCAIAYDLRSTLDDYADVFFIEQTILQRPQQRASSPQADDADGGSADDGDSSGPSRCRLVLSAREQHRLLELLALGEYVGDVHLVRLCAQYVCCWLMRSTEEDIIRSFVEDEDDDGTSAATATHTAAHDAATARGSGGLPSSWDARVLCSTQGGRLTPSQRLALLWQLQRSDGMYVDLT